MYVEKDEFIIRCGCHDVGHPIWFSISRMAWDAQSPPDEMFISLQVPEVGFWHRLKTCLTYLRQGHRKFWSYGDIVLDLKNKNELAEIYGLHAWLGQVLSEFRGDTVTQAKKPE